MLHEWAGGWHKEDRKGALQAKTLTVWAVGAAVWSGPVAQPPSLVSPSFGLSFGSQCLAIPR